jgi:hypothetical protein
MLDEPHIDSVGMLGMSEETAFGDMMRRRQSSRFQAHQPLNLSALRSDDSVITDSWLGKRVSVM